MTAIAENERRERERSTALCAKAENENHKLVAELGQKAVELKEAKQAIESKTKVAAALRTQVAILELAQATLSASLADTRLIITEREDSKKATERRGNDVADFAAATNRSNDVGTETNVSVGNDTVEVTTEREVKLDFVSMRNEVMNKIHSHNDAKRRIGELERALEKNGRGSHVPPATASTSGSGLSSTLSAFGGATAWAATGSWNVRRRRKEELGGKGG
ncbi:hypothetical protein M427DRAFT_32552 [Gonapodya prolifera JEL478]|uniref:Uncharacterized protein n=1 Tax=Gonapodya prolifera (strain JEL478) TaxID=1344416 RepID=A0A139AF61_GONPJ|nr:hypothetical protein M427DRAFT_32552 [Gonapodya prolifera JEL478]|eukprot:KXS15065.1 hypothetical protein M427DRAFT_32552 [Gonapodya prolifera JEL478]